MDDIVPLSSVISGMLLYKRELVTKEIVDMMGRFSKRGLDVDDFDDSGFSSLECCVDYVFDSNSTKFSLKRGFNYNTQLSDNETVRQFLSKLAGEEVLKILKEEFAKSWQNAQDSSFKKKS